MVIEKGAVAPTRPVNVIAESAVRAEVRGGHQISSGSAFAWVVGCPGFGASSGLARTEEILFVYVEARVLVVSLGSLSALLWALSSGNPFLGNPFILVWEQLLRVCLIEL